MKNRLQNVKFMMIAVVLALLWETTSPATAKPLKVFILAGQSNMQGHVNQSTFDSMADDPKTAPILKEMRGPDGKPRVCRRVWISSIGCAGDDTTEQKGKLTAGFGASPAEIGSEFTFGIYMEKMLNEPILIIKTSWGGRSLITDFRPPSAGPYVWSDYEVRKREERHEDVAKQKADKLKDTGVFYHRMIEHVRKVLGDLSRVVPEYDPKQGYELAGFVWFQGFNDLVSTWSYETSDYGCNKPGGYDMYSKLLTMFIRDVRKDLNAPKMPFVIGVMGLNGLKPPRNELYFRQSQAAPASLPEFKGNVVALETAPFWDDELDALSRRAARRNEVLTLAEQKRLKAGVSNGGYHYLGAAKIMAPIGKAFAEEIVKLQRPQGLVQYEPTWESLARHQTPRWFNEAVLGIYFHWGVYSVPAENLFYGMGMYEKGGDLYNYHLNHYGDPVKFGYKDLIPLFKAEKWDPDAWAALFERAGADFAGPIAEFHDGFAMWDSQYDTFNAKEMGPRRDVVGEMLQAVTAHHLKTIVTFHHCRNWSFFTAGRKLCPEGVDVNDPKCADLYGPVHSPDADLFKGIKTTPAYQENYVNEVKEVIRKYRPDQVWLEDMFPVFVNRDTYVKPMLAYYFNQAESWGQEVMVTHKGNDLPLACSELDHEQGWGDKDEPQSKRWQADTTLPDCDWSYIKRIAMTDEQIDRNAKTLVQSIVTRTSNNGVTLLCVSPKADGTLPDYQVKMLSKLGDWMKVNKVALHGAQCRTPSKAGNFRFTKKGPNLYAIDFEKPKPGQVIPGVSPMRGSEIRMLGCDKPLGWHQAGRDVVIDDIPIPLPCDYAWTFRMQAEQK
jgi:alpha-L-fucosidase